jgi:hypothetical protein
MDDFDAIATPIVHGSGSCALPRPTAAVTSLSPEVIDGRPG